MSFYSLPNTEQAVPWRTVLTMAGVLLVYQPVDAQSSAVDPDSPAVPASDKAPTSNGSSKTGLRIESVADAGWNIFDGDNLFAGYLIDSGGKPIVYPVNGPGGHAMTRNFPMKKSYRMERGDHDHHRSMWLTHGEVNGIDFWSGGDDGGKVVHRKGDADTTAAGTAVLVTQNDWMGPDDKRILSDTRRLEFSVVGRRHVIDCDFLFKATDGDIKFGDTKEGTFGMRVAASLKVDAKKGGMITNSELQTDKDAWGKRSPWVDYSGPVDNEMVGITIHNHPSSFGFPTRWHVRTYGLFAANPFARSGFTGGKKQRDIVLLKGKTLRLNYRVIIYQDLFDPKVAQADSDAYHNDGRPPLQ